MKRNLAALVLVLVMVCSQLSYASSVTIQGYAEGNVIFDYDFEVCEIGSVPSSVGNAYIYSDYEWNSASEGGGSGVTADSNGNKFFLYQNNTDSTLNVDLAKNFLTRDKEQKCLRLDFDLRTMGTPFLVYFRDMSSGKNDALLNLSRNANSAFNVRIQDTQWNRYTIIADAIQNKMEIWVNGIPAGTQPLQAVPNPNMTAASILFRATMTANEEAYIDNVKLTQLIPEYDIDQAKVEKELAIGISYQEPAGGIPAFTSVENLGPAAFAKRVVKGATGKTALGWRTYMTFVGTPAYIYEFDTLTGEFINKFPAGSGQHWALRVGSNGHVYHVPFNTRTLYEYDPVTQKNELLSKFLPGALISWQINDGQDGNNDRLYVSNQPTDPAEGSPLLEYEVKTGKFTVYEGFEKGTRYSHAGTGNEKYIFVGTGDGPENMKITRMDRETGERVVWHNKTLPIGGNVSFLRIIGDKLFTKTAGNMIVLDIKTMTEVDRFPTGLRTAYQAVSYAKPDGDPNVVYYLSSDGKSLMEYNIKTRENKENIAFSNPDPTVGDKDFGTWVRRSNGEWAISCVGGTDGYNIALITPGDPVIDILTPKLPETDLGSVVESNYYYVTRDDILYVGGYEAGLNGFDLKTKTPMFSVNNGIQHGMTMVDGKLFAGTYSSGHIWMLDPALPVGMNVGNPYVVQPGGHGVMRHYVSCDTNAGFGMIVGIADYGGKEGGVYLVTYMDGEPKVKYYGGIIPGENIIGVAYRDGYIYASSTVVVNGQPQHETAHIAKIDAHTGETLLMKTLNIPGSGSVHRDIGPIAFGPDGLLYGATNTKGTIFAVEPDTLEVVKSENYYPLRERFGTAYAPCELFFGADGVLYSSFGNQLHAINIDTMECRILFQAGDRMGIDNDGNILKRSGGSGTGTDLERMLVDQRQRLAIMIQNAEKYYKKETFSHKSWEKYQEALNDARAVDLSVSLNETVRAAARKLTFAIRDLKTVYDAAQPFGFPFVKQSSFPDITHYDNETVLAIHHLQKLGIISGTGEGLFEPERTVTRAEFTKMATTSIGGIHSESSAGAAPFSDVTEGDWFYPDVLIAFHAGWIKGTSETTFDPHAPITRQQAEMILKRASGTEAAVIQEEIPCSRAYAARLIYGFLMKH